MRQFKANAFQIKLFMAILMVFDHLPQIPGLIPPLWVGIIHAATRCVGTWFAFNAVEGFLHTRNQARYNVRLFGWAAFMLAGSTLLAFLLRSKNVQVHNNIFLTLAMGVLVLNIIAHPINWFGNPENRLMNYLRVIFGIAIAVIGVVFTEGGIVIIPFMLITYLFRNSPKKRNVVYIVYSIVLAILFLNGAFIYDDPLTTLEMILYNSDWLFISVLPFIYLYNGERGKNTKFTKYFFYIFYPAHLWIIAIASYFLK